MKIHIRDIVALTHGEYVCYLDGKEIENLDDVLMRGYQVDGISSENGVIRFDISKMQFTAPDSNDEFAKKHKEQTGEDISFF